MLFAMLAMAGCQKSEESVASSDMEAISFNAGTLTRASAKVSWTVGDQIAIFAFDSEEPSSTSVPLIYTVTDESGTLEAVDNCYYAEEGMSYAAIYPYKEGYSYASYVNEAATNFSYVDMLRAEATLVEGETEVDFWFDHVYARLELTFTYAAEFAEIMAEIMVNEGGDDEDGITLENIGTGSSTSATVSTFVAAGQVPDDLIAYIYIDDIEMQPVSLDQYTYSTVDDVNVWVAGTNYQLKITVEDPTYK